MYLTTMHPEILEHLKDFGGGLWAAKIGSEYFLIVKAPKEIILTAKINREFSVYLAPVDVDSGPTFALITAFFDDDNEPLVIRTPLVANDATTGDLLEFLSHDEFEVFFFDEHDRELLSYKASGHVSSLRNRIAGVTLSDVSSVREVLEQAETWFGLRKAPDDEQAVTVTLTEPLFPEDFLIMDLDQDKHLFNGAAQSFSAASLEREQPGAPQELDIAFLLQRAYEPRKIYANPLKVSDGKELVDIMVLGDEAVLLIQAKDSPNTKRALSRTIERKRIKSINQLKEGAGQLGGALAEIKRRPIIQLKCGGNPITIDLSERQLIGIVVVKELFMDAYVEYSELIFELMEKTEIPTVFFDYPELSRMTLHCKSEDRFLSAVHQIFSFAMEQGEFPRLRYSGKPTS